MHLEARPTISQISIDSGRGSSLFALVHGVRITNYDAFIGQYVEPSMNNHVLVAMGRNEESENALEYAIEKFPDATISVIHVIATDDPLGLFGTRDPETYMIPDCDFELDDKLLPDPNSFSRAQRKRAESVFDRACELSDDYGREIEPVVRSGEAVTEIVDYAESHAIDQIIIGYHEPTELIPIFRSVSESVTRNASMPVTVVC